LKFHNLTKQKDSPIKFIPIINRRSKAGKFDVIIVSRVKPNGPISMNFLHSYERLKDYFPGCTSVPMNKIVNGYVRSVQGKDRGTVIRIYA